MHRIRPPSERLHGLPSAWTPPLQDDPVEGVNDVKTNAEVFMACLKHLIDETGKNKRFKTRLTLLAGRKVDISQNTYAFAIDADEDFFEGSEVEVFIDNERYLGL